MNVVMDITAVDEIVAGLKEGLALLTCAQALAAEDYTNGPLPAALLHIDLAMDDYVRQLESELERVRKEGQP